MSRAFVPPTRRRAARGSWALFALVIVLLAGASAPPSARAGTDEVLLVLDVSTLDGLWAFVEQWEERGARFPHVYPPDAVIGSLPANLEQAALRDGRVLELYRRPAGPAPAKRDGRHAILFESWRRESSAETLPPPPGKSSGYASLLVPPPLPGKSSPPIPDLEARTYGRAFGANYIQTSEWMLGKIAVGVILPDFQGHTYAVAEVASVYEAVRGAMDFWASKVHMIPGARFVYDLHYGVRTSMDFMTHPPRIDEETWVPEIMGALGYDLRIDGSATGPVYEYLDSLRAGLRTEWGICLFIPKVPAFPTAYTAYSHFGGPFLVAPAGVQKDEGRLVAGSYWLTHVLIHETAHLFWALDESCTSSFCVPCHVRSGYLSIFNKNSMNRDYVCDPVHVPCVMEIPAPLTCGYTLEQMAVKDTDLDLIPDVLDTHPYVYADTLPDTINTIEPLIRGIAAEIPLVNFAPSSGIGSHASAGTTFPRNDVTFNTIEHLIYRIDGMVDAEGKDLWLYADPEGGWGGDSTRVHFTFVPDSLTGGDHTITIRAINTVGNRSSWGERRARVFVKAIALRDFRALPDYEGNVRVSFRVRGSTFGANATLYRSGPDGAETVVRAFALREDASESISDPGGKPGMTTRYRLEVSALGMTWNHETSVTTPAPIERRNFLSLVTPNPFRDRTVITYRVPRGEPTNIPPGGGKPNPGGTPPPGGSGSPASAYGSRGRYQIVRVEIDVFDLAGRLVRAFPRVHAYEGIYPEPVVWDGTDGSGARLPAGVYFIRFRAKDEWETRKVVLLP